MRHDQFEHVVRAVGDLLCTDTLIVIGSQAILASFTDLPPTATMSMEADILPPGGEADADMIDGVLGELSPFHESFGIYADGVGPDTATLPAGWEGRLVDYENVNTNGVKARCLEPHDLFVSKLYAGREKDIGFCEAIIGAGLVDTEQLVERIATLPVATDERQEVEQRLARLLSGLHHS